MLRLAALLSTIITFGFFGSAGAGAMAADDPAASVTRATLANGLKIIVVRDPLAPVVTTMLNYEAGGDEQTVPGQAHALEHMMFRGSETLSQSQLADVTELLGGDADADTQPEVTQYFFTAPAQYLDLLLRMEASRAKGLNLSQDDWAIERGAIKNEVTQDESRPLDKLELTMDETMFAGSPYGNNVLGTIGDFDANVNTPELRAFYAAYYHPNNAIYVIVGDVDAAATIAGVQKYFGDIPSVTMPARPKAPLSALQSKSFEVNSDEATTSVVLAYRFPGYHDKDYAAGQILEAVLSNKRANLYGLVAQGRALEARFEDFETHPGAGAADAFVSVPVATKPAVAIAELRNVLTDYRKTGVPAELVAAEKRRAIATAQFKANSIQGLAEQWSQAVAVQGDESPDSILTAIAHVSVDDVNRVLRTYVDPNHELVGVAAPEKSNAPAAGASNAGDSAAGGSENSPTLLHHDPLPDWAVAAFAKPFVATQSTKPVDMVLSNGARLVVIPESVSQTVVVSGSIHTNEALQAPPRIDGVATITSNMLPFGTTKYDRLAFRSELDKIGAEITAGPTFSLTARSADFDRGVELLAEEELHPAFPQAAFAGVHDQALGAVTGEAASPDRARLVALSAALYPKGDPAQRFPTPESVGNVTLADVKAYYASTYRPDLATIVVVGNVDAAHAKAVFEQDFGAWKSVGPKPNVDPPAVPENKSAALLVPDPEKVQSQVELAQVSSITERDPEIAALAVANASFGATPSSILFHDVRDVHGLVYGVYSQDVVSKNRSLFTIQYACDPANILAAQSLITNDLRALAKNGLSATDLLRGRSGLASTIPLRAASFSGIAAVLIRNIELGLPLDQPQIEARAESLVTNADITQAVSKWIRQGDFVRVIQGPGPHS